MQTSYSDEDICAEIGDDDLEAARDAGIFAAMVWKMISANVFFTWGPGPGHGLKNARRFASEGDCDLKLAEQHGNKMYGVGHQHAQEAASPNALNISISQKRDDDGNIDHGYIVHVHFFRKWNWHRTVTIKYELLRLHSGEWHLIGHNDDDERLLLQLSAAAGFVQNSQQLQELIHWVSNEQGTLPGNRDKRTTGVARFMLNLRPKYREAFTGKTKLDEFIKKIEKSYLRRDDYSLEIMGRLITPLYDIASMVEVLRTIQLNNCVVQIGRRKNPTEISTQGYYIENDPFFRPVIIADHRILQDHEGVCEEYFNKTKRTRACYNQKMCQSLSCIYHKSYMQPITNANTTPTTNRRVGVDFIVILRVKPQMCGVNTHKCLKGDLMNVLEEVDKNHSDKLISESKNMQKLKQWIDTKKKQKKEKDKQKKKQKKENQFKKKKNNSKKRAASSGRSAQPVPKKPRTGTPSEKQKKHEELPPDSGSEKQQKHEELPPDSGSASDNSESDSGSGADAETPPDSGSDGSMTTPPPASVGSTTPPDSGSASDNSESDSGSGADAETPPDSGSVGSTTPPDSGCVAGGGPGVIYVKYSHADQLLVDKDGVPTVGPFWNMKKDKFDPNQILVLKVGKTEVTPKAKAVLSDKEYEQIQNDPKYRGEWAMRRRGYRSQTANVTPQMVYSLFYKENISNVENSILQHLKSINFQEEIQHGNESFKCSLKDIQSACETLTNAMNKNKNK